MAEATRSRSELETMLLLRRVPLFEGLDPEDLQRIAATAVERVYVEDEPLMTEGDLGNGLVVLARGHRPGGEGRARRLDPADPHL